MKRQAFLGQVVDVNQLALSDFQVKRSGEIERLPDFDHFITVDGLNRCYGRKPGPWHIMYYLKSGPIVCEKVGVRRILYKLVDGTRVI